MDSYIERATQLIEEATSAFLKQVYTISENGPFRKARKVPSTFSMFHLANDEFYESAYFERMLEWYTRDLLINPILHGLLKNHSVKTLWPEDKQYVRYSTEALENALPFEFVICTDPSHCIHSGQAFLQQIRWCWKWPASIPTGSVQKVLHDAIILRSLGNPCIHNNRANDRFSLRTLTTLSAALFL